jgi:hypothetical protein
VLQVPLRAFVLLSRRKRESLLRWATQLCPLPSVVEASSMRLVTAQESLEMRHSVAVEKTRISTFVLC